MRFPYLRDHCPSWHDVQCLKNGPLLHVLTCCLIFSLLKEMKVNLVLIPIPWPEQMPSSSDLKLSSQVSKLETTGAKLIFMKSLGPES